MKWKNREVMKMADGLSEDKAIVNRTINKNADVLIECCNKIEQLSKEIEQLRGKNDIK